MIRIWPHLVICALLVSGVARAQPASASSPVISDEVKELTWIGFQQLRDGSRVFVRTNEPARFKTTWQGQTTLLLEVFAIFLGITASFAVEEWREQQQEQEDFERYLQAVYYDALREEAMKAGLQLQQALEMDADAFVDFWVNAGRRREQLMKQFEALVGGGHEPPPKGTGKPESDSPQRKAA